MDFETLVHEAELAHGHLCAGQILGVRMAMLGLARLGIDDPRGKDRKRLVTFVEIDRCATDAIAVVTGCRLGKRALKIRDWGKMAATFVDLPTGRAIRVAALESSKDRARELYPEIEPKNAQQMHAYRHHARRRALHGAVGHGPAAPTRDARLQVSPASPAPSAAKASTTTAKSQQQAAPSARPAPHPAPATTSPLRRWVASRIRVPQVSPLRPGFSPASGLPSSPRKSCREPGSSPACRQRLLWGGQLSGSSHGESARTDGDRSGRNTQARNRSHSRNAARRPPAGHSTVRTIHRARRKPVPPNPIPTPTRT